MTGGVPCYGVYPTQDGRWLAVGALEEKFWRLLCRTIGREDLFDGHLVKIAFLNGPKDGDLHLNGNRIVLGLLEDFGDAPAAVDLGLGLWGKV